MFDKDLIAFFFSKGADFTMEGRRKMFTNAVVGRLLTESATVLRTHLQ